MPISPGKTDAGLQGQNHYKSKLQWWRYGPRQRLLPLVRYETPYVDALQKSLRTSSLDSYFSITANLGTHTFFMIFLPVLAWCGHPHLSRALVHILAFGVFATGLVKDFFCLPRPLSPPLHRITMSHGAALEYGFPSTHSCNALSVAVYALLLLNRPDNAISPTLKNGLVAFAGMYAISIVLGRLYCGMHGFLDVAIGSIMGAGISLIEYAFIGPFNEWLINGGVVNPLIILGVILLAIRMHPEPADDCPCFDDSVAFSGVVFGYETAIWYHAQNHLGPDPLTTGVPFDLGKLGWLGASLRIILGVASVIAWRSAAKAALLRVLPPLFRLVGQAGFLLPRRFFKQALEYDKVPPGLQMDTLIPPLSKFPTFVRSITQPGRNRSVSIGPQSAADAYETIAYRQKVRRESQSKLGSPLAGPRSRNGNPAEMKDYFDFKPGTSDTLSKSQAPSATALSASVQNGHLHPNIAVQTPPIQEESNHGGVLRSRTSSIDRREREEEREEERAVFASIPKPRTKFDIEIATKLIVYSGISFITVGCMPAFFSIVGLV